MSTPIISLHVLTGCDHNSGFYGVSKKLISDRVQKSKETCDFLSSCGRELPVSQEVLDNLEQFVIRYVYCDIKHKNPAEVRAAKWKMQKNKNMLLLPPDSDSLRLHL